MQRNIQYGTLLKSYTRPEGSPPKKITVLRLAQDLERDANHSEVPQLLHPSEEHPEQVTEPQIPPGHPRGFKMCCMFTVELDQ